MRLSVKTLSSLAALFLLMGCASAPQIESLIKNAGASPDQVSPPTDLQTPLGGPKPPGVDPGGPEPGVVCDPLDGFQGLSAPGMDSARNGLVGKLSYLPPEEPIASSVYDFWNFDFLTGEPIALYGMDVSLFSRLINVPTRRFEHGFVPLQGEPLLTQGGEVLTENFSIYYQSNLILGTAPPGRYEIASLSDDGSVLSLMGALDGGSRDFILDNDGNHATRMRCSSEVVEINSESLFPLELFYHQGPRYHIALILMWRKLEEGEEAGQDVLCDERGNSFFFDFNTIPSTPKQPYLDLLDRGWEVIPSSSYLLPGDQTNPCVED